MKRQEKEVKFEREQHRHTRIILKQPRREILSTQGVEKSTAMATANVSTEEMIATTFATERASAYSNACHKIHSESHSKSRSGRYNESHDIAIRSIDVGKMSIAVILFVGLRPTGDER